MSDMLNTAVLEAAKNACVSTLASVATLAAFGVKHGVTEAYRSDAIALHVEGGHCYTTAARHVAFGFKIAAVVRAKPDVRQNERILQALGANSADGVRDAMLAFLTEQGITAATHANVWNGVPLEAAVVAEFRVATAKAKKADKLTPEEKAEAEAKAAAARVAKVAEAKRIADLARMTPEQLAEQAAKDLAAKAAHDQRVAQGAFQTAMLHLADMSVEVLEAAMAAINTELKARKAAKAKAGKVEKVTLANLGDALAKVG